MQKILANNIDAVITKCLKITSFRQNVAALLDSTRRTIMLTKNLDDIDIDPDEKSLQNNDKSVDYSANGKDGGKKIRMEWRHLQKLFSFMHCVCLCNICLQPSLWTNGLSHLSEVAFDAFGCLLYITDVITDILTGFLYVSGPEIDSDMFYRHINRILLR